MIDDPSEQRDRLIEAALLHVTFDGWSDAALAAGAREIGMLEDEAAHLFPGRTRETIAYFSRWADRQMVAKLEEADTGEMRIRDRVAFAVTCRLDALAPHREAVRRGLSWLALPQNAALGARLLYRTVDDIWYGIGDRSADFSFYTKRALLAGVVGSTTLFWLDDLSEDQAETVAFLDRRIADVMRIQGVRHRAEGANAAVPNPLRILRDVARKRYGVRADLRDSRLT